MKQKLPLILGCLLFSLSAFSQRVLEWSIGDVQVNCGAETQICYPLQVSIDDDSNSPELANTSMRIFYDAGYLNSLVIANVENNYSIGPVDESNNVYADVFGFAGGGGIFAQFSIGINPIDAIDLLTTPVHVLDFCFTVAEDAAFPLCAPIVFDNNHCGWDQGIGTDDGYLQGDAGIAGLYVLNGNYDNSFLADDEVVNFLWDIDGAFDCRVDELDDLAGQVNTLACIEYPCADIALLKTGSYDPNTQTISYTYTTTNTGSEALTGVTVTENFADFTGNGGLPLPVFSSSTMGSPEGSLQVGESATYTATYIAVPDDFVQGSVSNQATALGIDQFGNTVTDLSDDNSLLEDDPTVTPVNNPPVAVDDFYVTTTSVPVSDQVLTNDSDPDDDPLTVTLISGPSNGTLVLNPNGTFLYTPNAGFVGIDLFTYEICDPGGLCDQAVVQITVNEDPDPQEAQPPVAVDDYYTTPLNTPLIENFMGNDFDLNNDPLTATIVPIVAPVNGTVVIQANGTFTYTPNTDFVGEDSFTYQICDPGPLCDQAVVYITVLEDCTELVCAGQLKVSLQEDCEAVLNLESAAPGYYCAATIVVEDADGLDNVVNGCGTYKYVVTDDLDPNNTCWGYITAEDKQAPVLEACPTTRSGWTTYNYGFQEFICDDIGKLLLDAPVTYVLDRDGNIDWASVSTKHARWLFEHVTGYATFTDNCGDITVTVSDAVDYGYEPDCDDVVITRTFSAVDACGEPSVAISCEQQIIITKPGLEDVVCPNDKELDCEKEYKLDANGNPHPDVTGYPWLYQAFDVDYVRGEDKWWEYEHKAYLNPKYCNLGASYTDGARIVVCEGTYKFIRTWEILDWCTKEIKTCQQIIKVEDKKGPVVKCEEVDYDNDGHYDLRTYSTGPYDCTAAFQVPMPVVKDNCSSFEVLTEIVAFSSEGPVVATILPGKPRYVSGIPLGCHYIKYTVTDACGNKTVTLCPFQVEDQIEPIAVCDDDLNVSIGGQGLARVFASDIDEGSSDNCGPIRIEVRRRVLAGADYECLDYFDYDGDGKVIGDEVNESVQFGDPEGDGNGELYYYTPWLDFVDFTCCDMNENVRIELRVWDDRNANGYPGDIAEAGCWEYLEDVRDNYNVCWMDLLIEDKLPAYCTPPLPAYIDCDDLPYDFDPSDSEQMTELFGEASGTDNCPGYTIEELAPLTDDLNDCGYGVLIRRFQAVDAKGQTSTNKCEQIVTIKEQHHYKIKFPKDAEAVCGDPMPDTVTVEELACDLLAVSVKDDFFSASGDECYKIFRTYSVINWCEYDGISDPVVVSRDEDCDGKPGDEDIWVIVKTRDKPDPCYDYYGEYQEKFYSHVWYDRDSNPFNLEPKAGTKGYNCEYETNPFGFWKEVVPITENEDPKKDTDNYPKGYYGEHCDDMASVGYWQYTQVIKVYDNVDPIITWNELEPFCSYSSDFENDCPADITIPFTIDENCTPEDLTITLYVDLGQDGVLDDHTLTYTGTYPNFNVTGTFPLGAHYLGVSVEDGCGNKTGKNIPFEIVDCKAPSPICINGLAIELMPVIPVADADGDGDDDRGAMTIWASDFIASPVLDCTGEVQYSINRVGSAVDADQTGITLTCDDDASLLVEIWAWDGAGNGDFCETYVLVQDNMVQCPDGGSGSIAGVIMTEETETVEEVNVELSGNTSMSMITKSDGHFAFDHLEEGFDYTVTPQQDNLPLNGVSTYDLVLMSKHILGLQLLDSPYKRIAMDVNNDRRITAQDAIALRRLILNIDLKFANNTSWRFIPSDYVFPNPGNPWATEFPEVANINDLQGALDDQDFTAVKIGDADLSAKANAWTVEQRNTNGLFLLSTEDLEMKAGQTYSVDFYSREIRNIEGYQFALTLDRSKVLVADIKEGVARAENFGLRHLDEGLIATSWNRRPDLQEQYSGQDILFSLVITATLDSRLSEVLSITSRVLPAEAYDQTDGLMDVGIDFQSGKIATASFELLQNAPNPFRDQSMVDFYLPEAGQADLQIHDAAGKLIKVIRGNFGKGMNRIMLKRNDLAGAGMLYYTLTSGDFTATKKMILLD